MTTQKSNSDAMTHVKNVLIISSQVAASHVGSGASAICLHSMGIDSVILPTTLFGRHPGWGAPGGGAIPAAQLADMWSVIKQQNIHFDAILCGYMADTDQAELAANIIDEVKAVSPDTYILIDPVMGDDGELYVSGEVAGAIIERLVPRADILTPNVWELSFIVNKTSLTIPNICTAANSLDAIVCVTSVNPTLKSSPKTPETIGTLAIYEDGDYLVSHKYLPDMPHGGGDSFAGLILGHILHGQCAPQAMARATASIFEILSGYEPAIDKGELPLIRLQSSLKKAAPLTLKKRNAKKATL